jgi:Kelch motif
MKEKRDASASCAIGNCVMVMGGGETSTLPTNSVEILDVDNLSWKDLPRMKSKRFGCSAAILGNKVFVIGGRGEDGKHLNTVECLDMPMQNENAVSLGNFLAINQPPPSQNDANGDLKSLANTINTMLEQDKMRIKSSYESSKKQAQEMVRSL